MNLLMLIHWLFFSLFLLFFFSLHSMWIYHVYLKSRNRLIEFSWISTLIVYSIVMIGLFIHYLLGPTSSWPILAVWSWIFSRPPGLEKFEVSSLAPEHIINHIKLRFSIGLSVDWQSLIGPLCSNQAERLHLRHNSWFIFFTDVTGLVMYSI
jgi:hypothetical protein